MSFLWSAGQTPLTSDELQGLVPKAIATRGELDAVEAANITRAKAWLLTRRRPIDVLQEDTLLDLHRRMFGEVWRWAGEVRTSDKNIGVTYIHVRISLRELLEDVRFWISKGTFGWDEIGARFHHRLVAIHCFANGNGRHAREATDALLKANGQPHFSWGSRHSGLGGLAPSEIRAQYIAALRAADAHEYALLLAFVRS